MLLMRTTTVDSNSSSQLCNNWLQYLSLFCFLVRFGDLTVFNISAWTGFETRQEAWLVVKRSFIFLLIFSFSRRLRGHSETISTNWLWRDYFFGGTRAEWSRFGTIFYCLRIFWHVTKRRGLLGDFCKCRQLDEMSNSFLGITLRFERLVYLFERELISPSVDKCSDYSLSYSLISKFLYVCHDLELLQRLKKLFSRSFGQ